MKGKTLSLVIALCIAACFGAVIEMHSHSCRVEDTFKRFLRINSKRTADRQSQLIEEVRVSLEQGDYNMANVIMDQIESKTTPLTLADEEMPWPRGGPRRGMGMRQRRMRFPPPDEDRPVRRDGRPGGRRPLRRFEQTDRRDAGRNERSSDTAR